MIKKAILLLLQWLPVLIVVSTTAYAFYVFAIAFSSKQLQYHSMHD